jgi:ClpP class serine protease
MYKDFASKVAAGRKKSFNYIDSIGQGRVWSGTAGLKNGLVDVLGGLSTAINIAAEKANLTGKQYNIVEYPEPGLINLSNLVPKPFGIDIRSNKIIDDLMFRFKYNGQPIPILPVEDIQLMEAE